MTNRYWTGVQTGDWLIDWLNCWLIYWMSDCLMNKCRQWVSDGLLDWLSQLLKDGVSDLVMESVIDWLFDGVIECLSQWIDSLNDEKNGSVNHWLIDCWLIDWLIDWMNDWVVYSRNWYVMTRSRRRVCSTCWWTTPAPQWISTQVGQPSPLGQPGAGCSSTILGTCHLLRNYCNYPFFSFFNKGK